MKKRKNPLYDYNIYRVLPEKAEALKSFLKTRRFAEVPLKVTSIKNPCGYTFTLMFCDKDNHKGSPWVNLLSECSDSKLSAELRVYGAALICTREDSSFVVSYGNAHFYISEYCDFNFGVAVAERLINLDKIRAQLNISHGIMLSRMHLDYLGATPLSYRGGEIPSYIRGASLNADLWGNTINCGTSAQFKWEEKPTEIGCKLNKLNEVLKEDPKISLPRLAYLDEEEEETKIEGLYNKLADAIQKYDENAIAGNLINVPSFYMVGTRLIQNNSVRFKLSCNHRRSEFEGELSITAIRDFVEEKKLLLREVIRKINISVEYENDAWTALKPITEYIEFITEDNFCLRNGKWCYFNIAYMKCIFQEAKRICFRNHSQDDFSPSEVDLIQFAKANNLYKGDDKRKTYETFYNLKVSKDIGATCLHPQTVPIDPKYSCKYKYEVCDFIKGSVLYFVKTGQPSSFAYAFDQALLTLERCRAGNGSLSLPDGSTVTPSEFIMVLIFKGRTTKVEKWEDICSINFLIHLTETSRLLSNMNISLSIDFVYW